jgi:hypothetical protein
MSRGQALARSGGATAGTPGGSREDVCCIADLLVIVPRKVRINKRGNWRKSCARLLVRVMVAQAIFRSRLAPVVRRSRAVPQKAPLEAGMWLVGTVYNFCRAHRSLRLPNNAGMVAGTHHWIERTPAQAAGLTDHSAGRFMSCLSLAFLRVHPSDADDDRGGCWRVLMLPDCLSTVEGGTTRPSGVERPVFRPP